MNFNCSILSYMDKNGKRGMEMSKVNYRPKRKNYNELKPTEFKSPEFKQPELGQAKETFVENISREESNEYDERSTIKEDIKVIAINNHKTNHGKLDSLKVVGDMDCAYHVFVEDYVYTYLYQYAASDLSKESSAALIGEVYGDSKEIVIRGIIPIKSERLSADKDWIDANVMEDIEEERKRYFNDQDIIGWMHMQPGYGTMLTMKELREHKDVFVGNGSVCMLVDAINKIETLFVYEDEELKEQSGYCMYYERNEQMQQYMLDHPFAHFTKEEMKDSVVNQFREIGKIRKAEYMQRKSLNVTVMAISIMLIALTAVIVKMNDSKNMNQPIPVVNSNDYLGVEQEISDNLDAIVDPAQQLDNLQPSLTEADNLEEKANEAAEATDGKDTATQKDAELDNGQYGIYIVQPGDTLADISYKLYGEARRSIEIAKINAIKDTNQIYVGQELKIPKNE